MKVSYRRLRQYMTVKEVIWINGKVVVNLVRNSGNTPKWVPPVKTVRIA